MTSNNNTMHNPSLHLLRMLLLLDIIILCLCSILHLVSHAIYPYLCLHFFYIFEGSPSYVQTHSSFGKSPILWKKHIQSLISANSLYYHGHMNMSTCNHTSLYTHKQSMSPGPNNNVDHFEYYLPTLRATVVLFPCQKHV